MQKIHRKFYSDEKSFISISGDIWLVSRSIYDGFSHAFSIVVKIIVVQSKLEYNVEMIHYFLSHKAL